VGGTIKTNASSNLGGDGVNKVAVKLDGPPTAKKSGLAGGVTGNKKKASTFPKQG